MEQSIQVAKYSRELKETLFKKLRDGPLALFDPYSHGWTPSHWARAIAHNLREVPRDKYYNILQDFKKWAVLANYMEFYGRVLQAGAEYRYYYQSNSGSEKVKDMEMKKEFEPDF
jgi:hypothetical protein